MSDHGAAPQSEIAGPGRVSDDHYANYLAVRTRPGVSLRFPTRRLR